MKIQVFSTNNWHPCSEMKLEIHQTRSREGNKQQQQQQVNNIKAFFPNMLG
jgi:hypothetical protein